MPTVTQHRTLDVRGIADLQHELTGKRPTEATIRSYHSRGLMPSQIEPGRWAKKDIQDWLRRRRIRPSADATTDICDRLTKTAHKAADNNDRAAVDHLVHQAREINVAWTTIGRALEISGQAAWARYRRATREPPCSK